MSKETKEVNAEQHSQSDRNKLVSEYTENGDKMETKFKTVCSAIVVMPD